MSKSASDEGQIVRYRCLAQQHLGHARPELIGHCDAFVGRFKASCADQHGDLLALVQYLSGGPQAADVRNFALGREAHARMHRLVRERRIVVRHQLQIVGQDDAGDGTLVLSDAHSTVHHVAHLAGDRADRDIVARDVLE